MGGRKAVARETVERPWGGNVGVGVVVGRWGRGRVVCDMLRCEGAEEGLIESDVEWVWPSWERFDSIYSHC